MAKIVIVKDGAMEVVSVKEAVDSDTIDESCGLRMAPVHQFGTVLLWCEARPKPRTNVVVSNWGPMSGVLCLTGADDDGGSRGLLQHELMGVHLFPALPGQEYPELRIKAYG